jgi:excinuclease ABC subunit C
MRCVEAIDIAHLAGGETGASARCASSTAGRSRPGIAGIRITALDEHARRTTTTLSIREVVSRRYREAGAGQELYPDVILIDGGLGQLHAALQAFEELAMKPPMVISLAKKEETIYVQRESEPIRLGRDNAGLKLCQSIRDEAHRFAQHYHHVLRRKKTLDEE